MFLAEMGPDAVINHSFDLGSRDIDQNHDWLNDAKQHYNDINLADASTFVQ
jgi:hypothetical protein